MMYIDLFVVLFFSVTLLTAAMNIPVMRRSGNTGYKYAAAAAVLSVCDHFLFSMLSCLDAVSEEFVREVNKNKETAENASLPLFQSAVNAVHSIGAGFAEKIRGAAVFLAEIYRSSSGAMTVCLVSALIAAAAVLLISKKEAGDTPPEAEISLARQIIEHIWGNAADGFFSAPFCAALVSLVLFAADTPYYKLASVILWLLSYIPFIGPAAGTALGALIYLVSGHFLYGALFIAVSAALFAGTGFISVYLTSRFEIADSKRSIESDIT